MPHTSRPARLRGAAAALLAVLTLVGLGSCAYYNTFYIARKYYDRATGGLPYRVDHDQSPDLGNLNKSIDYSKKLMANYPKSKWVDDAYLLWAKGFLAKDDPLQTVTMLEDFSTRFPNSPLKAEATFYRAVALRQARRYTEALTEFDSYFATHPKGPLVPYAHLEYARTLRSLERPADAAQAAGIVVDKWPKSPLAVTARTERAEARFAQGDFEAARRDYRFMGDHARTDDERLDYLLRESECLEAARQYEPAMALLRGALAHERPPQRPDTTGGRPLVIPQTPGYDRYGRLLTRLGTVQLMSGDEQGALASYRRVVDDYPRTPVSAEAQYRVGYAYEIGADDFESARLEYAKVRDQNPGSPFVAQATQRQTTLDQLARFRSAGGADADTAERHAQAGFLLAEQYLFQLQKPERALVEYRKVSSENPGSPWAAKALNAEAWVLKNKLEQPAAAESLWWKVVHEYPATEGQLAARDYLEAAGKTVPAELIKLPPEPVATDTAAARPASGDLFKPLTNPPDATPAIGSGAAIGALRTAGQPDSATIAAMARARFGSASPNPGGSVAATIRDSILAAQGKGAHDGRLVPQPPPGLQPPPGTPNTPPNPSPANLAGVNSTPPGASANTNGATTSAAPLNAIANGPGNGSPGAPLATGGGPGPTPGTPLPPPNSLATPATSPMPTGPPVVNPPPPPAGSTVGDALHAAAANAPRETANGAPRTAAPDTAKREPLPPLEFSPVRPGITFPAGPPRTLGFGSHGAEASRSLENAVIGAPVPAPNLARPRGGAPADTSRAATPAAAADTTRAHAPKSFQPRGSRFQ